MAACSKCGRKFAVDRIKTHENICSHTKERKPYDVAMMRVLGTDAEDLVKNGKHSLSLAVYGKMYYLNHVRIHSDGLNIPIGFEKF